MQKKIIFLLVLIFSLTACSRQEKIDSSIFLRRLTECTESFMIDENSTFYTDNKCVAFIKDLNGAEYVLTTESDENNCVFKISVSSALTEKPKSFIELVKCITDCYVTEDSAEEIIKALYPKSKIESGFKYHDTQWYSYSSVSLDSGVLFSVQNKKLSDVYENELTLKPNDKSYIEKGVTQNK